MTLRQVLSLAGACAVLVLSLVTLAKVPTVVEATDCWVYGSGTVGQYCRAEYGQGTLCELCVGFECHDYAPLEDEECYFTCAEGGDYFCNLT
jgi:hypothetical protein